MTKSQMLLMLKEGIREIHIQPVYVIHSKRFFENKDENISEIINFANHKCLIVRSSCTAEDTEKYSNAGRFKSILNVTPDRESIALAVQEVYQSYGTDANEEILIQPMLEGVVKSGVVFTKDMETYADYYVVNYQDGTDTSAVTGGNSNGLYTFVSYKKSPKKCKDIDMERLFCVCRRIEDYLHDHALDVEFAITNDGSVFILQVRPIAKGRKQGMEDIDISHALNRIYKKAQKLSKPHPFLLGQTTCFGVMPDWNPAEILGVRPKKLAISLYKEMITDSIWAHQRKNYGYRDLTMHPLMISFCGVPYIDTRITFNSFIPKKLNERIAGKLVNYYLERLMEYPKYHDKIEFEIVFSCYYLGLPMKLKNLLKYGFNENEIARIEFSLLELTNDIINPKNGLYLHDIDKIQTLECNYDKIVRSDISLVDKIYWLIEECKEYGTLPFAGVARAGFIAVQFLRSFVDTGIITCNEYDAYMNSLDTVNRQMSCDLKKYHNGEMSREQFLDKYGHIRPGTYDIMSKRYDEAFDEYFSIDLKTDETVHRKGLRDESHGTFSFTVQQMRKIQRELDENGLCIEVEDLMSFVKASIEGREYLKFVFTKSISKILQLVEELGNRAGIAKSDMAHIDISIIRQLYVDLHTGMLTDVFRQNIANNKGQYECAVRLKLPSIIVKPDDVYNFYMLDEEPNFITQKTVTAKGCELSESSEDIKGKIVFIPFADPGYDYIFTKSIAGLITQFGGVNSHMAIRCAELGIPAVIGVGENRFKEWCGWRTIELDCLKRQAIRIE